MGLEGGGGGWGWGRGDGKSRVRGERWGVRGGVEVGGGEREVERGRLGVGVQLVAMGLAGRRWTFFSFFPV